MGLMKFHKFFKSRDVLSAVSDKKCDVGRGVKEMSRLWLERQVGLGGMDVREQALENKELKGICTLGPPARWQQVLRAP